MGTSKPAAISARRRRSGWSGGTSWKGWVLAKDRWSAAISPNPRAPASRIWRAVASKTATVSAVRSPDRAAWCIIGLSDLPPASNPKRAGCAVPTAARGSSSQPPPVGRWHDQSLADPQPVHRSQGVLDSGVEATVGPARPQKVGVSIDVCGRLQGARRDVVGMRGSSRGMLVGKMAAPGRKAPGPARRPGEPS